MNRPIRHLAAILGAVAIVAAAAVALPATAAAAPSIASTSIEVMSGTDMDMAAMPGMAMDAMSGGMRHDGAAVGATQLLAATATLDIIDEAFSPKSISVTAGTAVTWTNRGAESHTVTGPGFASGRISPGGIFSFTFVSAGTFKYVCDFHSGMTGTVVVTAGTAGTPPPAASTPPSAPPPPTIGATTVEMRDNAFSPSALTVAAGTTVTWVNRGTAMHTVTTNDALFHSGLLAPGKTFSYTFGAPGTYAYLCAIHPGMTGTIVVTGIAPAPPAAAPLPVMPAPTPAPPVPPIKATTAPAPARGSITTVVIAENNFTPGVTTVPAGTTVVWENHGQVKHTVTSSGPTAFDSGVLSTDGRFSVTFSQPGRYPYICEIHPGMSGMIEVLGVSGAAPVPAPAAAPSPTPALVAALPGDTAHIFIIDNGFDAAKITVSAGTTVTWMNHGQAKHTVTFSSGQSSDPLATGQSFARRFDTPGTYTYLCALHPGMTGTVEVTAAAAPAAPAVAVIGHDTIGTATTTKAPAPDPGWILIVMVVALATIFTIGVGGLLAVRTLTHD